VSGSHARRRETPRRGRGVPLLVAVVLLAVSIAGGLAWRDRTAGAESGDSCSSHPKARLAAAPAVAPVLSDAVADLAADGWCPRVEVTATAPAAVLADLTAGDAQAPDLWVPDSGLWSARATAAGISAEEVSASVVASPVVLAGGASAEAPASWFAALESGDVQLADPTVDTAAALTLLAPTAERVTSRISEDQIRAGLVTVAQRYADQVDAEAAVAAADDPARAVAARLAGLDASSSTLVPVTEQQYLAARADHPDLTAVTPETGALFQRFPMLATSTDSEAGGIARELLTYLTGPGEALAAEHGFRRGTAAPIAGGTGVGEVEELAPPSAEEVIGALRQWQVLTVPSSILAVLDASGSMDYETSEGTRMELAVGAARTALAVLPGEARVGLWLFSIDQGGKGVDHRQLEPLVRLDAPVGKATQREALGTSIQTAVDLTEGGTGLYDTTLAAVREAQAKYDPAYFNSVVIISDGANDDPGSISLKKLLATLAEERDPEHPVRIIAIGISKDADMKSLTRIAEATGGKAYGARDPRDILGVLNQALLAR
jgi:extracellular solute-binding protein/von Willebrand factor type A domain-containing protein